MTIDQFFSKLTRTFMVIIIVCVATGIYNDEMEMIIMGSIFSWSYFAFTLVHLVIHLKTRKKELKHDG